LGILILSVGVINRIRNMIFLTESEAIIEYVRLRKEGKVPIIWLENGTYWKNSEVIPNRDTAMLMSYREFVEMIEEVAYGKKPIERERESAFKTYRRG
jgi:hypothetical protein